MTKPELDISIERWAAEYREQAILELSTYAALSLTEMLDAVPLKDNKPNPKDQRYQLTIAARTVLQSAVRGPWILENLSDVEIVEWAARLDGSEIKSYETWADTVAQDEMSEEAYAEWKGAGL